MPLFAFMEMKINVDEPSRGKDCQVGGHLVSGPSVRLVPSGSANPSAKVKGDDRRE